MQKMREVALELRSMWGSSKNRIKFIEIQLAANDPHAMQMQEREPKPNIKTDSHRLAQISKPLLLVALWTNVNVHHVHKPLQNRIWSSAPFSKSRSIDPSIIIHRSNHLSISIYVCLRIDIGPGRVQLLFRRVEPLNLWCLYLCSSFHVRGKSWNSRWSTTSSARHIQTWLRKNLAQTISRACGEPLAIY